jgi:hypothetical protein
LEDGENGERDGEHPDERGVREDGARREQEDVADVLRVAGVLVDPALPVVVGGGPEPTLGREQGDDRQHRGSEEAAGRDGERDAFEHRIRLDRRQ